MSPSGTRAVFEARGEILTVPAEKGDIRNLTNTPGAADRDPAWSPDGKSIAYFSDESGEYSLTFARQDGRGEVKKIKLGDAPSFFYNPSWSPDSKWIAYARQAAQHSGSSNWTAANRRKSTRCPTTRIGHRCRRLVAGQPVVAFYRPSEDAT